MRICIVKASLFDDGKELFSEKKDVKLADNKEYIEFEKSLPEIKKWSAEKPNLYSLVIAFRIRMGNIFECVSSKAGFRKVGDNQFTAAC